MDKKELLSIFNDIEFGYEIQNLNSMCDRAKAFAINYLFNETDNKRYLWEYDIYCPNLTPIEQIFNVVYRQYINGFYKWCNVDDIPKQDMPLDFILNEDIILFLEDLNEPVYKIDRMLSQLFNVQKIKEKVKGIVIGEFQNIDDEDYLNSLLCEFAEKLNVPMSSGFKITHSKEKETIPVGAKVVFDSNVGTIKIIEDYLE